VASVSDYGEVIPRDLLIQERDRNAVLRAELDKQQNRGVTLHELNAGLRKKLRQEQTLTADLQRDGRIRAEVRDQRDRDQRDRGAVLRGTIGRLEDTIEKLLGYTECGCGEDEEGHYGKCVPCTVRDEGVYS
jgi:hypothetical protein